MKQNYCRECNEPISSRRTWCDYCVFATEEANYGPEVYEIDPTWEVA